MSDVKQKLELHWVGKNNPDFDVANIEPRILEENTDISFGDVHSENKIIHGDNLLALKSLLPEYQTLVKCVYIDPPYNTGNAFKHYDDAVEHSIWLSLMRARLILLRELLSEDGILFCQLSDDEMAYGKVLLDEVFGRSNFVNQVSVKMKQTSGASGGGEDKRLKKNIEYILIYAKNYTAFSKFNEVLEEADLFDVISQMRDSGKSWKYTRIFKDLGTRTEFTEITDGSGMPIKIFKHTGVVIKTIPEMMSQDNLSEKEVYIKYFDKIFRDTNAQSSIRTRVMEATKNEGDFFSIDYVPRSGKSKGQTTTLYYKGNNRDLIAWLRDVAVKRGNSLIKLEKLGTYWDGFPLNNLTKEGDVLFPNGKKPEALLKRILELATQEGDLVLDSFLGSGTTAAVAHKMKRKYVGIEVGDQAYSHVAKRLKAVVEGTDQSGISKELKWTGGGGFKFFELAPSFIKNDNFGNPVIDSYYDGARLIKAMCKLSNYQYKPSSTAFWKHGSGHSGSFIFVTSQLLSVAIVQQIVTSLKPGENLLICAKKYEPGCTDVDKRITIKKIPQSVLKSCQFGKKEYLLPIKECELASDDLNIEGEDDE